MKIFIEKSLNDNPYENLAMEAALSDFVQRERFIGHDIYGLFLWQSKNAIVFGRNQNIQAECDLELARAHHVDLVRRNSGGGAVYHDLGNLNFTFFGPDSEETKANNNEMILAALKSVGINAEVSGRNDFTAAGRKFSGNAYTAFDGILVHHGTLMIDLDIELATQLLTPPESKLLSKGISSVKSRIVNLSELIAEVSVKSMVSAMAEVFENTFLDAEIVDAKIDNEVYKKELNKLTSEAWLDVNSVTHGKLVTGDFGFFKFSIVENEGKIKKICYESDILEVELIECMVNYLAGVNLSEDDIADCVEGFLRTRSEKLTSGQINMINAIGCEIINSIR